VGEVPGDQRRPLGDRHPAAIGDLDRAREQRLVGGRDRVRERTPGARHLAGSGILAAVHLGINQGRTEALNNKVRLIIRRAYGFHTAEAALALVMLTCGPITLRLPHQPHAVDSP
jgi:hypothetical protein